MDRPAPDRLELVRAFVNTRDIDKDTDALADPARTVAWLIAAGLLHGRARVGPRTLERILTVREAFRGVLVAHADGKPADDSVEVLNRTADKAGIAIRLSGPDSGTPVVVANGVDGALGQLVAIAFGAIADGTWRRLKACPSPTCQWAFYDASRNRSSRWCDMGVCGNRAKRRAFQHRRHNAISSAV